MILSPRIRKLLLSTVVLIILYITTRIINLTTIPIFTDEAIYIRWSQIGTRDANWRFISLSDGKQPLYTWIAMVFLRLIPDPLVAGRSVSILAGFFTLIAIGLVSYELFKSLRLSFLSCFLYIISPFSLLYDRLALYDSLVSTLYMWSLYVAILLVRSGRLDTSLLLGMTLGLGMLNKTSGFLSLFMLPVTLLLFDSKSSNRIIRLLKWTLLVAVAAFISLAMYSILRLSPLFNMISQKDSVFVYPLKEWLEHPFLVVWGNLAGLFDWTKTYLTLPIFIAAVLPIIGIASKKREKILLYCWWILPFLALGLFGKVLYPRFILFMCMPLLILASYSIIWIYNNLGKTKFALLLVAFIFYPSLRASYYILTNPLYAPLPYADRGQLIDDWPSGWGVKEVNAFILQESKKGKVSVYTEGTFGLLPYAIEIYLVDKPGVTIFGLWPVEGSMPEDMINNALDHPTYLVLNLSQKPPKDWSLKFISEYQKGTNSSVKLRLYQVIPRQHLNTSNITI